MQLSSYLAYVCVVQSCVHLVQDEEGGGTETERCDTNTKVPNSIL